MSLALLLYCTGYHKNINIMKNQAKIVAAILAGAAAGAAIALLLAPDSGENLRGDITDYINDAVNKAKDKAQSAGDSIKCAVIAIPSLKLDSVTHDSEHNSEKGANAARMSLSSRW